MAQTVGKTLRFGIAGIAAAGAEIQSILKHPNLELVAVADRNPEILQRFRAQHDVQTHDNVEALCQNPNVDAIFIGTPTPFHTEHVLLAAQHGKHAIVAKPMALRLEEAQRMVDAVDKSGILLVVGHSQAFEPPILKIRELIASGKLGRLRMINTWYYTDWIYRGRVPAELDTNLGGGVVYRQAAHQFDIVRYLGGGLVRSVRAVAGIWDDERPAEGAYAALFDFEDGAVATAVFSGYDHFHSVELGSGVAEGGQRVTSREHASARRALKAAGAEGEGALKASRRSGESRPARAPGSERFHSQYGLTIVSCEHGDIRQTPEGFMVYGDEAKEEITFPADHTGRDVMVDELYQALTQGRAPRHDARWGMATLEAQLAVLQSSRERRDVPLHHQVATPDHLG
jgi:phthalate 4,5-cis-dihydrodiol dehydrogenase